MGKFVGGPWPWLKEEILGADKELGVLPDEQGVQDIGISYDESWRKSGYSSHNGIGSVVDLCWEEDTGSNCGVCCPSIFFRGNIQSCDL